MPRQNSDCLSFAEFYNVLARLSPLVFPCETIETVFFKLLLECVLPLARRIKPAVEEWPPHPSTGLPQLLEHFHSALHSIFQFYAKVSHLKLKDRISSQVAAVRSPGRNGSSSTNMRYSSPTASNSPRKAQQRRRSVILYSEFHRFSTDFGLCAPHMLSMLEVGDLFHRAVSIDIGGRGPEESFTSQVIVIPQW